MTAIGVRVDEPHPIVEHNQSGFTFSEVKREPNLARPGMALHIRQCLLSGSVQRQPLLPRVASLIAR
jgi:hypothetical protein